MSKIKEFACKSCGHIGEVKNSEKRGNFWIETILWTIYVAPGIAYSIWRRSAKKRCVKCDGTSLVSLKSKEGKIALEKFYLETIIKPKK